MNPVSVCGIDQVLIDIEASVAFSDIEKWGLGLGESHVVSPERLHSIYKECDSLGLIKGEYPGGQVGNILHNLCANSSDHAVLWGSWGKGEGGPEQLYGRSTHSRVGLDELQRREGPMGKALALITPDGERTFVIAQGVMDTFCFNGSNGKTLAQASLLVLTAHCLRNPSSPIFKSVCDAAMLAKQLGIPVLLSMGSSELVQQRKAFLKEFLSSYVNVVSMNRDEAYAFTELSRPELATNEILQYVDVAMVTCGASGLYLGGYIDTSDHGPFGEEMFCWKSVLKSMAKRVVRVPGVSCNNVVNTNGAGDAASSLIACEIASSARSEGHSNHVFRPPASRVGRRAAKCGQLAVCQHSARFVEQNGQSIHAF